MLGDCCRGCGGREDEGGGKEEGEGLHGGFGGAFCDGFWRLGTRVGREALEFWLDGAVGGLGDGLVL